MDMLEQGETEGVHDYGLERLTMLSDGVFAIAMTLLALDVRTPPHWDGTLADLWARSGGAIGTFALSFAITAMYWSYHRRIFRLYARSDAILTTLNLVVLGLVTLLPFVTRAISEFGPQSDAVYLYVGALAAIGGVQALQWGWAAFVARLTHPLSLGFRLYLFGNMLLVPATMSALGLLASRSGLSWLYVVMAVIWAVLLWLRRRFAREAEPEHVKRPARKPARARGS